MIESSQPFWSFDAEKLMTELGSSPQSLARKIRRSSTNEQDIRSIGSGEDGVAEDREYFGEPALIADEQWRLLR